MSNDPTAPQLISWPEGLNTQLFLDEYWQKKPLLIRNAFPDFETPLSADELAGLSLEEDIASRIIREDRPGEFMLAHGPFEESIYTQLGTENWSLLVSDIDKHVPAFADWLAPFKFLPDWRIDDLMISFAPDGASVGAHVDQYDVFLLQASGLRRWHYDNAVTQHQESTSNTELRIVDSFKPDNTAELSPGDMLYLPPGVAHHGIAVGDDCTTWSIGFRAPSYAAVLNEFTTQLIEAIPQSRYNDPPLKPAEPGELHQDAIDRLTTIWQSLTDLNERQLAIMCGKLVTQNPHMDKLVEDDSDLPEETLLTINPFSRMSYSKMADEAVLFCDGEAYNCSLTLAQAIFSDGDLTLHSASDEHDRQLILGLFQQNSLIDAND